MFLIYKNNLRIAWLDHLIPNKEQTKWYSGFLFQDSKDTIIIYLQSNSPIILCCLLVILLWKAALNPGGEVLCMISKLQKVYYVVRGQGKTGLHKSFSSMSYSSSVCATTVYIFPINWKLIINSSSSLYSYIWGHKK